MSNFYYKYLKYKNKYKFLQKYDYQNNDAEEDDSLDDEELNKIFNNVFNKQTDLDNQKNDEEDRDNLMINPYINTDDFTSIDEKQISFLNLIKKLKNYKNNLNQVNNNDLNTESSVELTIDDSIHGKNVTSNNSELVSPVNINNKNKTNIKINQNIDNMFLINKLKVLSSNEDELKLDSLSFNNEENNLFGNKFEPSSFINNKEIEDDDDIIVKQDEIKKDYENIFTDKSNDDDFVISDSSADFMNLIKNNNNSTKCMDSDSSISNLINQGMLESSAKFDRTQQIPSLETDSLEDFFNLIKQQKDTNKDLLDMNLETLRNSTSEFNFPNEADGLHINPSPFNMMNEFPLERKPVIYTCNCSKEPAEKPKEKSLLDKIIDFLLY